MPDDQSMFDFLQPQAPQGGLQGALSGGLRGLSDFFQQATPTLLQDEESGFGDAFAAGLLGGLGGPSRKRDAVADQKRQEAMKFLPTIFDKLDTGTQEKISQAFLPGVKLREQMSDTEKELFSQASSALRDPRVSGEDKRVLVDVIAKLDPALDEEVIDSLGTIGLDSTPEIRESLITGMTKMYTAESYGEWERSGYTDYSLLEEKEDKGGGKALSPSQQFNQQAFRDFLDIEEYKQSNNVSDKEAAAALGISGGRFSNVARATGQSTGQGGVITAAQIHLQTLAEVVRQDLNVELAGLSSGGFSDKVLAGVFNKAMPLAQLKMDYMEKAGISVLKGEPSPRNPAAQELQTQTREKGLRLQTAVQAAIDAGDTREPLEIAEEINRTGDF